MDTVNQKFDILSLKSSWYFHIFSPKGLHLGNLLHKPATWEPSLIIFVLTNYAFLPLLKNRLFPFEPKVTVEHQIVGDIV